jgi:hypothetical protein
VKQLCLLWLVMGMSMVMAALMMLVLWLVLSLQG